MRRNCYSTHEVFVFLVFIGAIFLACVDTAFTPSKEDKICSNSAATCSECIFQPLCQWCAHSKEVNSSEYHCFSVKSDLSEICHEDGMENPQNSDVQKLEDEPLTNPESEVKKGTKIVQLRPQHITLKLRKGKPINFTVSYRQVKDYPLDLYYLMDLSKSMKEDKKTLADLGKTLATTMRNLTSQFKIGFGSFVDKVMLPFVNTHPEALNVPCDEYECATPFSFKNNLKLTDKDEEFTSEVNMAKISTNLDSPEGGFDALMQAMVCKPEIGWRDNVRKILVFSTDAQFHIAGDGKLAGVINPNDGQCHLNDEGYYDKYDQFDYPSIGQINDVAQSKGINIIFAVKGNEELYKKLSDRIKDSVFGKLEASSNNVINVITDVYKSITGKVEISVKTKERENPLSIRFFSDCGKPGDATELRNGCTDVREGSEFDFTVEMMVTDCPKDKKKRTTSVTIGTLQDIVRVDVDLLCDCDCESPKSQGYEKNSKSCSEKGTKQCDICSCYDGFYGEKCQCSSSGIMTSTDFQSDQNKCRPEGSSSTDPTCSGRGRCECETCICWKERHHGKFCQCDSGICLQHIGSNIACSGNGKCECNSCTCNPGWEGQFCECRSKQNCIPKDNGNPCSDNGECSCGKCECKVPYTGQYCEECPTCGQGKCLDFRTCVQCQVWQSGHLKGEACKACNISKILTLPSLDAQLQQYALLCTFWDELTGCDFNFTYKYMEEGYHQIFAQNIQKCPQKINILAATFGVIGAMVAIGLLTLIIWKILTTIYDQRELKRFNKERANAKWTTDENPLYQPASSTITNPAYSTK